MTWMILLVGLVVGMVSGVVGIGGGILFVPALIWLLGMDQHKAQGTSLGALLAPVGIFAFWSTTARAMPTSAWRCCWPSGFWWAATSARSARNTSPELWLRRIFALTLIAVGGRMWFSR